MISGTYTNIWIPLVDYIYLRNKKKKKKKWFIHEPIESGHLRVIGTFVISKKRVDNRAQINYNTT